MFGVSKWDLSKLNLNKTINTPKSEFLVCLVHDFDIPLYNSCKGFDININDTLLKLILFAYTFYIRIQIMLNNYSTLSFYYAMCIQGNATTKCNLSTFLKKVK